MRGPLITAFIILYPIIVHASVIMEKPQYGVIYLLLVITFLLAERSKSWLRILLLVIVPLCIYWIVSDPIIAVAALYLFPVLVCILFFTLFVRTLRAGEIPLVTRMALLVHGDIDEYSRKYTRTLTKVWAAFFMFLALECTLLAVFASFEIWSLFTNIINYLFVILVFIADFLFRKKLLPSWHNATLGSFLNSITKVKIKDIK